MLIRALISRNIFVLSIVQFRIVRVKLYQAFLLSGGPQGRLACGDELLLMECSAGEGVEDVQSEFFQPPTSL